MPHTEGDPNPTQSQKDWVSVFSAAHRRAYPEAYAAPRTDKPDSGRANLKMEKLMANVSDAMKKLAVAAPKLNKATDAVNATFRAAEEYLNGLSLGIETSVFVSKVMVAIDEDNEAEARPGAETTERTFLEYSRIGGRFRLAIGKTRETMFGMDTLDSKVLPSLAWDQAGRIEKLEAVAKLPELLDELAKQAEILAEAAEKASGAVAEILGGMK